MAPFASSARRLAAAASAALALAACTKVDGGSGVAGARHSWTKPGVLRIGSQVAPNTLNPILAANTTESSIDRLMFDVLVSIDETGRKEVPMLARVVPTLENGGISRDGLTITYRLRPNVQWQDGAPLTSRDVAFTWRAIMSPNNNVLSQNGYSLVRAVDTPDPLTAVFHMKQRFSPAVDTIFGESDTPYGVLPEHLLGKLHDINTVAFNAKPVGSGPFILKEWVRGDHMTLTANPHYFLGAPKLKTVTIRFIPDENTEVSELKTHDIDWQFEASPQLYSQLKSVSDVKVVLESKNEYERIQINTRHAPLGDVRVRRAIGYAIDAPKLVADLTFGSAQVADQDLPAFEWAHANDVARYPHDVAKARALLAEAGWKPGPDGIAARDGKRLSLTMVTNTTNATRRAAVVQAQAQLRAAGIEVVPKFVLGSLLFATMGQGGILQNGKYDLAWTGWVAGVDPDDSSLFLCSAQPPHGSNETHICDPKLDAAEHAALDRYDRPARTAAYATTERILAAQEPQVDVWWPRMIQPINPDLKHFNPNPVTETWDAYTWDI